MQQNVYMISLTGISVVFALLIALYFVMKLFEYLPSTEAKEKKGKKNNKFKNNVETKSKNKNFGEKDKKAIAIISILMAKKNISKDRISIKKIGGI